MSIDLLKIQTCVVKVKIECDGCAQRVKRILQKIDGMYFVRIDTGGGKVVVAGDVDPEKLVKKIKMGGKHAEIWGGQNRNHQINPKFQNLQVDNNKVGRDSKSHARRVRKVVMVVEEVNVKVKLVSGRAKEARRSERGDQWLEERRSIAPTWI